MFDVPTKHRKAPEFLGGFDRILRGDDPDYGHVAGAPQMGTSSVEHTQRLATFQAERQG